MTPNERDAGAPHGLEEWIEGRAPLDTLPSGATDDDPLLGLLVAARSAAPQLSDAEAAQVFSAVRPGTKVAHGRGALLHWAAAAAAMVMLAIFVVQPWRRPPPGQRTIAKQVLFEAEHQGKVVRLEITLYRIEEAKGERHVAKPSL
jgi:hypothetical protein